MRLIYLSSEFYKQYKDCPEILKKPSRPYACLTVKIRGLTFAIPFRHHIAHKYAFITYNLVTTILYTGINIPYGTLNSLMTRDQYQRSVINLFRMTMGQTGSLVITAVTLPIINYLGGTHKAWIQITCVYAIMTIALFLICFKATKERVRTNGQSLEEEDNQRRFPDYQSSDSRTAKVLNLFTHLIIVSMFSPNTRIHKSQTAIPISSIKKVEVSRLPPFF